MKRYIKDTHNKRRTKATLRHGESLSINGYKGEVKEGQLFDFEYEIIETFYIIIDGERYEEASTAFDFINIT